MDAYTKTVGDIDGFGFNNPNNYQSAQGSDPDTNGNGIIEPGEFLPDQDSNGAVNVSGQDQFDNRSSTEKAASKGEQYTDISLQDDGFPHKRTVRASSLILQCLLRVTRITTTTIS